jgi:hypothetical protein
MRHPSDLYKNITQLWRRWIGDSREPAPIEVERVHELMRMLRDEIETGRGSAPMPRRRSRSRRQRSVWDRARHALNLPSSGARTLPAILFGTGVLD